MPKPTQQIIRINERGAARVLNGNAGMIFIVENWVGVGAGNAAVLDYRYPDLGSVGRYSCWTIPPDGFEVIGKMETISETPATGESSTFTVAAQVWMDWQRIADAIVGAVESGYSPWLGRFDEDASDPGSVNLRASLLADKKIWYAEADYYRLGGKLVFCFDNPDDDEGTFEGKKTVGPEDLGRGVGVMARVHPQHFADLVAENDDAITHDVFLQCVIFGELIYG